MGCRHDMECAVLRSGPLQGEGDGIRDSRTTVHEPISIVEDDYKRPPPRLSERQCRIQKGCPVSWRTFRGTESGAQCLPQGCLLCLVGSRRATEVERWIVLENSFKECCLAYSSDPRYVYE